MDLGLKNKIVVVTGAAGIKGSIGETIVQSLANEGAIPVIVCRNDRGYGYQKELQERGIDAIFVKTDLSDPAQIEKAAKTIGDKYGHIDVLINNVGVNDGAGLDASIDDFMYSLYYQGQGQYFEHRVESSFNGAGRHLWLCGIQRRGTRPYT